MMIPAFLLTLALAFFGVIGIFLVTALRDGSYPNSVSDIEYDSRYSDALRELKNITANGRAHNVPVSAFGRKALR